ncbi:MULTISPECIES: GTPase Era [Sedimentibacter]|uniref:GTPase Era n=1 Tax=Sedimentibacter hydroxybenzoicus DSM 7310 TaxID=1123245 RepID=A0A974BI11_SEDHY|nr:MULTISPECIES: GTPase Era [Sedimentibacter]NYB73482.1 GTPase Era [Sedimentibacter hydroxybenzoicus DSM 7310]HCX63056.1 GTPase Era [Clostridiales bacterium]
MFKSGFVTIIGRPNVGKSTLMNSMIGEKISIMSDKPQTTRNKIRTVYTDDEAQIVFLDTPGIHKPKNQLGEFMNTEVDSALDGMDVLIMITDEFNKVGPGDEFIIEKIKDLKTKKILIINKIDKFSQEAVIKIAQEFDKYKAFDDILPMSAIKNVGVDSLIKLIIKYLKPGPMYFPSDYITDRPERFVVSEIIREKTLLYLNEEVPHGIAVEIEEMKERKNKDLVDIRANILCEKKSHKSIIIGKDGRKIKGIGKSAREDIERLLGSQVNLQLFVKISENWRDNNYLLRSLGYDKRHDS